MPRGRVDLREIPALHAAILRASPQPPLDSPPMAARRRPLTSSGPIGTNCYVVRAERGATEAVVVDPSGDAAELRLELAGWARAARRSSSRTAHWDHLVGVADLAEGTGAPVYMSEGSATVLESPDDFTPPGSTVRAVRRRTCCSAATRPSSSRGSRSTSLSVPGHSPGHLAYHARRLPLLGRRPLRRLGRPHRPPGADWETLLDSIRIARRRATRPRPSSTRATARRRRSAPSSRAIRSSPSSRSAR